MTAITTPSRRSADHYRLADIARSEWTKFISVSSSRWILAAFIVLTVGFGVVVSAVSGSHWPTKSAHARAIWDPTNMSLAGLAVGTLLLPVLGVLLMSGEYSSGSIRSTLAAVPKRPLVLAAKATVFGTAALAVGEAVTLVTFLAGQAVIGPAPHASLGQPGVLRAVALSGAFLALMGLFGLGLGTVIRHSAAAIATYAGLVLLLPIVLLALPGNAWRFGPEIILGNSVGAVRILPGFLSPWAGFAAMALYAGAALVAGGVLLVRRDA
jgi:ABC-2 type transport system permease protein